MKRRIFFVAAVLCISTLHAQETQDPKNLEEVTVTATRFSKKLKETGKVVSVLTADELSKQGSKDLVQVLNEQTGIIINGANSNMGKDKTVYLRGANYGYTLILMNGVPVADPSGVGGAFDLRMIPLEQIERIEIVKGAQSVLYGTDAVAGVINIITKNTGRKTADFYGGVSYGSFQTLKANAGLGGNLNGTSYNIGFVHHETDGISEAADTLNKGVKNGLLNNALSVDLSGRVAENLYIKPFFRYSHYKGSIADGAFQPAANPYSASLLATGTQAVYNHARGSITGLYTYDEVKRNYSFDNYAGDKKTAEVFSHYNFAKQFQALAGLRFDRTQMKNPNPTTKDTSVQITSPYFSVFLKNLGGFYLEAGSRLNLHSKYGNNFTYSINPSFLLHESLKLFVNFGTAFRAPSLSELYGQWGPNPDLKPESSQTLEAGLDFKSPCGKWESRAVYFSRNTKDVITYGPKFSYINYNRQKDHGWEFESKLQLLPSLQAKLFYSYVTGNVTASSGGKDTTYNNLLRRPKHSGGLTLNYQVSSSFFVSSHLQVLGKRNDLYFDPVTYQSSTVQLDPYTLWNFYAQYSLLKDKINVFGQVNNLLNKEYYEVYGYSTLKRNFSLGLRWNL